MKHSLLFTLLLGVAACTAAPGPQDSGIEAPSVWARLTASKAESNLNAPLAMDDSITLNQTWWTTFDDNTLNALIDEALQNNKTLAIAKARVEEARANRGETRSLLFPQIDIAANATRANQGYYFNDKIVNVAQANLEANWEVDLFGRNQSRVSSANALLESEEDSRQAVTVGLLAEVARTYFDLRNYEHQIEITRKNLESQQKTAELTEVQVQGALASDFDLQRARAQVSTTESQLPTLRIAYDAARNRLNVLLGHPPGTRDDVLAVPQELKPLNNKILVNAPARILANRPDVRAAERRFAASIAAKDATWKEWLPTIGLFSFYGIQTTSLIDTNPWSIAASLTQPVLNFGRIESRIDAADARQKQAFGDYQETVLEALEDMENGLSNYTNETGRNASLQQAVDQTRRAADLAKLQYTSGYNGLLDVLVAERSALDAESALTASNAKLRQDLVHIYTAAGGGWNAANPPAEK